MNLEQATNEAIRLTRLYHDQYAYIFQNGADDFVVTSRPLAPLETGVLVAIYKNGHSIKRAPSQ